MKEDIDIYNNHLQKYFEDENNFRWFLAILEYNNPYKNEIIGIKDITNNQNYWYAYNFHIT